MDRAASSDCVVRVVHRRSCRLLGRAHLNVVLVAVPAAVALAVLGILGYWVRHR